MNELINNANKKETGILRVLMESIGGELDFKLQLSNSMLYLANGVVYNKNEAGNFVWAYFLESHGISGQTSGILAQGGSLASPIIGMNGSPRFDEEWDRQARWAGVKYYYDTNNITWLYYLIYGAKLHV